MTGDRFLHLPTSVDEALLEATRIGMLAEQTGLPLLPWQQRAIDLACIVDRTGARPDLGRRRHVRAGLRAVPRDARRPVRAEAQVEEGRPRRPGQHDRGE